VLRGAQRRRAAPDAASHDDDLVLIHERSRVASMASM
jgi:hypothetical protein